jgi:hypothetical protein
MVDKALAADRARLGLVLAALLRTRSAEAARAVLEVLAEAAAGSTDRFTRHRLRLLLEDRRSAADEDEVWDLLIETGVAAVEGKQLLLRPELMLECLYDEVAPRDRGPVVLSDVLDLLTGRESGGDILAATPRELTAAIQRAQAWGSELMLFAQSEELPGFPVFWDRNAERSRPFGVDVGTMAASDTLLLYLEPGRFGLPVPSAQPKITPALERAWDQLLGLGINRPGDWYDGSLEIPFFDDDFVGSFVKEYAAHGSCPTLEATAERAYALMLLRAHVASSPERETATDRAVAAALRCITRWQSADGGWAIHCYQPGSSLSMPMRDLSTWYAVRTLLTATNRSELPAELRRVVIDSLVRARDLLLRTAISDGDKTWWEGDFFFADPGARWRATCLLAQLLGPLARQLADDELPALLAGAVRALASEWVPDAEQVLTVEFRCPTWEGAALATFTWELPRDALAVQTLTSAALVGVELGEELVARVHQASAGILAAEVAGSWLDIPLKREGLAKAFASNTLHALRGVLNVLVWQVDAVPPGLHAPIGPREPTI